MTQPRSPASAALAIRQESLYHEARVLILICQFSELGQPFRGLTKLAKLDLNVPAKFPDGWEANQAVMAHLGSHRILS